MHPVLLTVLMMSWKRALIIRPVQLPFSKQSAIDFYTKPRESIRHSHIFLRRQKKIKKNRSLDLEIKSQSES